MREGWRERQSRRWRMLPGNARGAAWMLAGGMFFSVQSVIVKKLGAELPIAQVAFFRCLFGLMTVLPFVLGGGTALFLTGRPFLHAARAVVGVSGMFCGFYSVTHLPLAEATAISFTKPLFMIFLAVLFLGESVRWRRWTATAIGFLGVVIIVRPGGEAFNPAALVALFGAFLIADVVVLVKKLSASDRNLTILVYFGIITTLVSAIPALLVWVPPRLDHYPYLILVGVLAMIGQSCSLRAYRVGEATAVVPFDYTRLIFATGLGFLIFAEVPDGWSLLGAAVLIASTLYIARREFSLDAEATPAKERLE